MQEEQKKMASNRDVNQAEDQQQVLKKDLLKICETLLEVTTKSALLAKKKDRLQLDLERKEIKKEKALAALTSKGIKQGACVRNGRRHLVVHH